MKLLIKVKEINGRCPVYSLGDKIVLDEGYIINVKESNNICMHSLASILPYYNALYRGVKPIDLGLNKEDDDNTAYVQCLDPCKYTGGGTVIFQIKREESEK